MEKIEKNVTPNSSNQSTKVGVSNSAIKSNTNPSTNANASAKLAGAVKMGAGIGAGVFSAGTAFAKSSPDLSKTAQDALNKTTQGTKANVSTPASKSATSSKLAGAVKMGAGIGAGIFSAGAAFGQSNPNEINLSNSEATSQSNTQTTTESTQSQDSSQQNIDNNTSQTQNNSAQQTSSDTSQSTSSQNSANNAQNSTTNNAQSETNDLNNQINSSEQQLPQDDLGSDSASSLLNGAGSGTNYFTKLATNVASVAALASVNDQSNKRENNDTSTQDNPNQQESDRSGENGQSGNDQDQENDDEKDTDHDNENDDEKDTDHDNENDENDENDDNDDNEKDTDDDVTGSGIIDEDEDDLYGQDTDDEESGVISTGIDGSDAKGSDNLNLIDDDLCYEDPHADEEKKKEVENIKSLDLDKGNIDENEDYEDYDKKDDKKDVTGLNEISNDEQKEVVEANEALLDKDASEILSGDYLNKLNLILDAYDYHQKDSLIKTLTAPEYATWYFKVFDEHIYQLLTAITKKDSYEKAKEYLPNYSFNKKLNVEYLPKKAYDYLVTEHYGIKTDISTIISTVKEGPDFLNAIGLIYNDLKKILDQIDEKNKWLDDNLFESIPHIFIKHYQETLYGSSDDFQSSFFAGSTQSTDKKLVENSEADGVASIADLNKWIDIKSKETKKYNNTPDYDFDVDVFKKPVQPSYLEGLSVNDGIPPNYPKATFTIGEIIDLLKKGIKLHQVLGLYLQMARKVKRAERKVGDLMNKLGAIANALIQMLEDDPLGIYASFTKFSISDLANQSPVLLIGALMGLYTKSSQKFNQDFGAFSDIAKYVGEKAGSTYNEKSIFMHFYNTELQKILKLDPDIFNNKEEELYGDLESLVKNTTLKYEESIHQTADYIGNLIKYFDKVKEKFDNGQETNYISTHRFLAGKTKDFYTNIKEFLIEESGNLKNHSIVVAASPSEEIKEMNEVLIFLTYVMSLLFKTIDDDLMAQRLDLDSDIMMEDEYIQEDDDVELPEFIVTNQYEKHEPEISEKLIFLDRTNFYLRQNGFLHIDSSTYTAEYVEPNIGSIGLNSKIHVGAIMVKFNIKDAHSDIRYLRGSIQELTALSAKEKENLFNNIMQAIKDYVDAKVIIAFIHSKNVNYQYQIPDSLKDDDTDLENQNEDFEEKKDDEDENNQENKELTEEEKQANRLIQNSITDPTYKYDFDIINKDTQPMDLTAFFMRTFNAVTALDNPYERFVPTVLDKNSVIDANLGTLDQLNDKLPSLNVIDAETSMDEIIKDKVKYHAFLPVIHERRRQSRMSFRRKNASPQRKF